MKLLLIDGASLAYRSYYAFKDKPLINSKGIKTGAPFAFTNSLLKLLKEIQPTHVAVVFDAKGKTFRHIMYEEYKAQRPKAPHDFIIQLSYIKEILDGFNIKRFEIPEVEADDVIATLSKLAESQGFDVYVASMDKDLCQIVTDRVKIVDIKQGDLKILGVQDIVEKFGVKPSDIPVFLALSGDKIDNIPGVPGIGEKTAAEIINKYGDIFKILDSEEVRGELCDKLRDNRDRIIESYNLSMLREDLNLDVNLDELKLKGLDKERLFRVFSELEFYSLMRELAEEPEVEIVNTSFVPMDLLNANAISVECEGEFIFLCAGGKVVYRLPLDTGLAFLKGFRGRLIAFDTKRLYKHLFSRGVHVIRFDFDVLISAFLLDSDKPRFDPDTIFLEYLGAKLAQEGSELRTAQVCRSSVAVYPTFLKALDEMDLWKIYDEVELPLQEVLAAMELSGIKVDVEKIEEMSRKMEKQLEEMERNIYDIAGQRFNINSPKQLSSVLFEKHKLKPVKKTKTGYSTDEESLSKLAALHPLPAAILQYRQVFKLKSTYIDVFRDLADRKSGRIFPTYNQAGTATGRISCLNPNFQTIPIRSDLGKEIRDIIVAEDGYEILAADYSQIELRVLAHLSGDENLKEIFEKGLDVHTMTAAYLFGKRPEEISEGERRKAKTVNFGIVYGISPYGLAKELDISVAEAEAIIQNFFASFPGVMKWIQKNFEFAQKNGFVRTLFGRIRRIPYLKSSDVNLIEQGKRIAINTPVQGTAADIIKISMVEIFREIKDRSMNSRLILQVHDELLLEVMEPELDLVKAIVKDKMEHSVLLKIPLKVDIGVGKSWLAASNK
ncbi:MAG TPA: DNA polymerase I [Candidatus Hydrothermia bacterium]|nr:DNA polymerase I [Candidatus Hydrothermae bacterium]MDD3649134.1 DNA polymerase I [Candidatus Hydrothermia bacterium]MDD5572197.1 DNA polymerase I [Candidatus Hydrothermia bacterium]HOK23074.1 DNA polymerase I [Candidatus Hydrothermia bacterium]HOL23666.1 DNA polymerase I [Candidatus Hydrothermia bacterium]